MNPNETLSGSYMAGLPLKGQGELTPNEEMLLQLLQQHEREAFETIRNTYKRYNLQIRSILRQETGLTLNPKSEDTQQSIPIYITDGIPTPIRSVFAMYKNHTFWRLMLHRTQIEQAIIALSVLVETFNEVKEWVSPEVVKISIGEIARTEVYTYEVQQFLARVKLIEQIKSIKQDVLGAYYFNKGVVEIYWMVIVLVSKIMNLPLEHLTIITMSHELAHAYTHIGYDIDDGRWDTEVFSTTNLNIIEGLAQFYTEQVCRRLSDRDPTLIESFKTLRENQPVEYQEYATWAFNSKKRSEIIRATMLRTRIRNLQEYEHFLFAMMHSSKSLTS
jgi:hypothetical protein